MRILRRRMTTIIVVALSTIATLVSPAVAWADCGGRMWNPVVKACVPPPAVPEWYQPAPTWAQPWAPPWAPPPPPPPPPVMCGPVNWSCGPPQKAVWDPRYNAWTFVPQ